MCDNQWKDGIWPLGPVCMLGQWNSRGADGMDDGIRQTECGCGVE